MNNNELAEKIRNSETWNYDLLAELCDCAGIFEEWKNADGETFECVAYKAAEILGVNID